MRIVIKIGTNVLTTDAGLIQEEAVQRLTKEIFGLRKQGHEIILVSSGAVGCGKARLPNIQSKQEVQIWAAVGQPFLMSLYSRYAEQFGFEIGQFLILRSELTDRERYTNLVEVLEEMLKSGVLPIINGNDVIAMADLVAKDNDMLAAMIAVALKADRLLLLTNQEGFFTANPLVDSTAKLIKEVKNVDFELEQLCAGPKSSGGSGGMLSKIRAAKHAVNAGIETLIVNGREKNVLEQALQASNHIGTKFLATKRAEDLSQQKRWLMAAKCFGQLVIDDGAVRALRNSKSLLLPGIISVRGVFDKGEIVEVVSNKGLAIAYGKTNYNNSDIYNKLNERKQSGKGQTLEKEVIHHDHMTVLGV